jgi:SAM-dependent methyltransferase
MSIGTNKLRGYNRTLQEYGLSPEALQWKNYNSAAVRYRQLLVDLDLNNKTVLDVGCGMGDLLPFLCSKSKNFKYLGVDVNESFINLARKRYEGFEFKAIDPFEVNLERKFDVVILCGALNSNRDDWLENRKRKITKLYELANEVVVFNMAASFVSIPQGKRVAYANAVDILEFCTTLTPKVILQGHYHPKDITITMFKQG